MPSGAAQPRPHPAPRPGNREGISSVVLSRRVSGAPTAPEICVIRGPGLVAQPPRPCPGCGLSTPPCDPSACLWTRRARGLRHGHCLAGLSCTDRLQPGRCWSPGGGLTLGSLALAPPAPTSSLTGVCSTPHFLPPSSAAPVTMRRSGAPRIHPLPGLSGAGLPSPSLSFPRRAHWSSRPGLHASGQGVTSMRQEQLGSQGTARTQLQEGKPRRAQRGCALLRSQGWSSGRAWAVPQPVSPTGAPLGPADVGTGGDNA